MRDKQTNWYTDDLMKVVNSGWLVGVATQLTDLHLVSAPLLHAICKLILLSRVASRLI